MTARLITCFICFTVVTALVIGCSDTVSFVSERTDQQPQVTQYFPLEPGLTASYRIDNANGLTEFVTYTIGAPVDYQANQAYRWIKHESNGAIDTSFFFASSDGLYFLEGLSAQTEKMLGYPLTVGKSWSLYDDVSNPDDTVTIGAGGPDSTDGGNTGASPSFFVEGGTTLSVVAVEGIQLEHGSYYSGTVKVRNVGVDNTTNYYWYAPGIGLVKYVLGATEFNPDGQKTGEMISYSR